MGGGDLNQKKSWHPHTLKNQEKVWKAEQAKSQEEQKLKDLRREIEQERDRDELKRIAENGVRGDGDKKLEWMYKNSNELVNREEYLLGRNIDKSFELLQAEEVRKSAQPNNSSVGVREPPPNHVEHECIPFSIRAYRNFDSKEQVDLQRKVMEDPLMLIKQREMESRRKILENPVKLKELHRILKTDKVLMKTKKSKKSKKKSSKKHKKKSKYSSNESSSSECSDDDDNLDRKLAKRVKKLKDTLLDDEHEKVKGLSLSKLLDAKYETISKELDKAVTTKKHNKRLDSSFDNEQMHSKSFSRRNDMERRAQRSREKGSISERYGNRYQYRSRSRSRDFPSPKRDGKYNERDGHYRHHSRSRSNSRGRYHRRNARSSSRERNRPQSKASCREYSNRNEYKTNPLNEAQTKKNSTAEKEARLNEMMSNAIWRETDRTNSVRRHREEYAREEDQHKKTEFDTEFMQKEVKKAIDKQTSVGSRIRSNLNNIQRTSAMSVNFARK